MKKILFLLLLAVCFSSVQKIFAQNNDEKTVSADQPAEFKGGEAQLYDYIEQNLNYPKDAAKLNIQGKVLVNFVIEKDGSISNVRIFQGVHESLDNEAIRIVNNMPRWLPGKKDGQLVRSYFTLPINFILK